MDFFYRDDSTEGTGPDKASLAVTAVTCRVGTAHVNPLGATTHMYPLW